MPNLGRAILCMVSPAVSSAALPPCSEGPQGKIRKSSPQLDFKTGLGASLHFFQGPTKSLLAIPLEPLPLLDYGCLAQLWLPGRLWVIWERGGNRREEKSTDLLASPMA